MALYDLGAKEGHDLKPIFKVSLLAALLTVQQSWETSWGTSAGIEVRDGSGDGEKQLHS